MERFNGCSLFVRNFKCFGAELQGFEQVRRLNLIIGRNNSGKSALLDLVRFAVRPFDLAGYAYKFLPSGRRWQWHSRPEPLRVWQETNWSRVAN